MFILRALALEPMHSYGISVPIEKISNGVLRLHVGSLFLAIQRLERARLIKDEWKSSGDNSRANYYVLTAQGRRRLTSETQQWEKQVAATARILEAS